MIYGNKREAAPIKKIDLRIWRLRDEVETVIRDDLQKNASSIEKKNVVEKCRSRYARSTRDSNVLSFKERKKMEEKLRDNPDQLGEFILGKEDDHPDIPENKITLGSLILSEIDINEMFFFCNRQFMAGQSIVIEFVIPNVFTINAEVLSGRSYNMKVRVISANKLPYRTHAKFNFYDDKEKLILERFIKSIESKNVGARSRKLKEEDNND